VAPSNELNELKSLSFSTWRWKYTWFSKCGIWNQRWW